MILRHFMLHRPERLGAACVGVGLFAVVSGLGLVIAILLGPEAMRIAGWLAVAGGAATMLDAGIFLIFLISSGRFRERIDLNFPGGDR